MADAVVQRSATPRRPFLPPRPFVTLAWRIHRAIVRVTGGRRGLWLPRPGRWGAIVLRTVGRRTGRERMTIVGYYEDGPNLVTLAMNGWAAPEPAWWLNLQEHPEATVTTKDGTRQITARVATGDERARLWARWQSFGDDVDGYATRRPTETAVVVLEPRSQPSPAA